MITLYQYCDKCKTEKLFDVIKISRKVCGNKNKKHKNEENKKK